MCTQRRSWRHGWRWPRRDPAAGSPSDDTRDGRRSTGDAARRSAAATCRWAASESAVLFGWQQPRRNPWVAYLCCRFALKFGGREGRRPGPGPLDTPGHAADSAEPMPMPQTAWTTAAAAAGPPEVTPMTTAAGIQPPGAPGPPTFVFGAMGGGSLRGIPGAPVHVAASKAVRVACPG